MSSLDLFSELPNPLLARPYVVIDFETTGLYPAVGDEIVELGLVRVENGKLSREYSQLVQPGKAMDPAAAQVSGISEEMLKDQPSFATVADEYLSLFDDAVVVAHNAEFDMGFLQYKLVRMGRPQISNPVLDTLELARAREDTGPCTLGILANRLGIEGPHTHRALDDAKMAAHVLIFFLDEAHRQGQDDLARLPGYRHSFTFAIDGSEGEEERFESVVSRIRRAIDTGADLDIEYRGSKGASVRRVTPHEIKGMNVRGHCHKRNDELDFRLDRILECAEAANGTTT